MYIMGVRMNDLLICVSGEFGAIIDQVKCLRHVRIFESPKMSDEVMFVFIQ